MDLFNKLKIILPRLLLATFLLIPITPLARWFLSIKTSYLVIGDGNWFYLTIGIVLGGVFILIKPLEKYFNKLPNDKNPINVIILAVGLMVLTPSVLWMYYLEANLGDLNQMQLITEVGDDPQQRFYEINKYDIDRENYVFLWDSYKDESTIYKVIYVVFPFNTIDDNSGFSYWLLKSYTFMVHNSKTNAIKEKAFADFTEEVEQKLTEIDFSSLAYFKKEVKSSNEKFALSVIAESLNQPGPHIIFTGSTELYEGRTSITPIKIILSYFLLSLALFVVLLFPDLKNSRQVKTSLYAPRDTGENATELDSTEQVVKPKPSTNSYTESLNKNGGEAHAEKTFYKLMVLFGAGFLPYYWGAPSDFIPQTIVGCVFLIVFTLLGMRQMFGNTSISNSSSSTTYILLGAVLFVSVMMILFYVKIIVMSF